MLSDAALARAALRLTQPAFAAAARRLEADLRADLAQPLLVPPPDRPAGYYHDYFCPQHSVQLEFAWDSPHAHRCPVDGAVYRGDPYDRSWWWFVNHANSEAAFRLALGWRLRGDRACLERLGAIYATYAAGYPQAGWPKDDSRGRQGKVAYHALDEAVWLVPLAWAYHLAASALSPGQRAEVEGRLLFPAAEHLLAQRWLQVHNYMCWLNAGVAAAAVLTGRDDLLAAVIGGPYGFRQQIEEGVLADGTWWEGTASYHYYTAAAFLALVRSLPDGPPAAGHALRAGSPPGPPFPNGAAGGRPLPNRSAGARAAGPSAAALRRHPRLRAMFRAPLRWAYPDLTLPAMNDCWYHSSLVGDVGHGIPPADALYEIAAGWYGDPAFGYVLAANYGPAGRPRDSVEALLYGPDDVPAATASAPSPRLLAASADLPDLGLAVHRHTARPNPRLAEARLPLSIPGPAGDQGPTTWAAAGVVARGGRGVASPDQTFVLLKYGQHGGGHGHYDKLGLLLFAHGERLSPDLGTPGYGIPLNDTWYRHTISHNTVLIDGQPQPPAAGTLRAFHPLGASLPAFETRPGAVPEGVSIGASIVPSLPPGRGATPPDRRQAGRRRFGVLDAEVSWPVDSQYAAYAGVRLRRVLLVRRRYFLDLFAVECSDERQIEWAYHNLGQLVALAPTHDGSPGGAGHAAGAAGLDWTSEARRGPAPAAVSGLPPFLEAIDVRPAEGDLRAEFAPGREPASGAGGCALHVWLAGLATARGATGAPPLAIAARAPATPAGEPVALLLRRCRARRALFASLFCPHPTGDAPFVRAVSWQRAGDSLTCQVKLRRGADEWRVTVPDGGAPEVRLRTT